MTRVDEVLPAPVLLFRIVSSRYVSCPGFSWRRVHFLLSSWSSAVFWIQDETDVDNILMFQLLLSSAYAKSGPCQLLLRPCQRGGWGAQAAGRGHSPASRPRLARGIFRTVRCHGELIRWGELAGGQWPLPEDWLGVGQQVVSDCNVHHLYMLLGFPPSPISVPLNCFTFFSSSLPDPPEGGVSEWLRGV